MKYITVEATFTPEGRIRPTAIIWTDGRRYEITRILKERREFDRLRYDIIVDGQMRLLYAEDVIKVDGRYTYLLGLRWWVEKED